MPTLDEHRDMKAAVLAVKRRTRRINCGLTDADRRKSDAATLETLRIFGRVKLDVLFEYLDRHYPGFSEYSDKWYFLRRLEERGMVRRCQRPGFFIPFIELTKRMS